MKSHLSENARLQVQYRLIAVWALAEGFMGGILHGLHIPVTGLVVGSISVCCLALLSKVSLHRGDLLKATFLVLAVKAMLSPHSPPMAYFAVFIQGALAALLFNLSNRYKLNCFLLAILTQLQSAIQHIIVVLVVFGLDLFQALNQYLNKISATLGLTGVPFALYLVAVYLGLHLLTGIVVGWVAGKLPEMLRQRASQNPETPGFNPEQVPEAIQKPGTTKKKTRFNVVFLLIWALLAAVFLQSYFGVGPAILPKAKAIQIIIRSVLIISVWYFMISPFLMERLHNWLRRRQHSLSAELLIVQDLLPEIQALLKKCWAHSSSQTGFSRIRTFVADAGARLFAIPE